MATFEDQLEAMGLPPESRHFKGAIVDVMDTAGLVLAWLNDRELRCEPLALVRFTDLILARQRELRERAGD